MTPATRLATLSVLAFQLLSRVASAESGFATPPGEALISDSSSSHRPLEARPEGSSTLRVSAGPALRVSGRAPEGGLAVALDVGARAAGFRASGSWLRASSEQGLSQYAAELWIDFGAGQELHPIIGAGAGISRIDGSDDSGESSTATVGVGVLRGSLEYELPISGANARVGIDLTGSVPATPGGSAADARPWLLAVAHVGVGF